MIYDSGAVVKVTVRFLYLFIMVLVLVNCTTAAKHAPLPQALTLAFGGKTGETSETRYYSNARILTYQDQQLLRDRTEGVDFTISSHMTEFNAKENLLKFEVRTTRKDGTVELHDLAFPELSEQIDYVIRSNGEVLQAGRYPPTSLFYVPAMPIPATPVQIGDTWTMDHIWYSAKEAIPLKLQVVGILKNIVTCEKTKVCADVEISGDVNLAVPPNAAGSVWVSRLWGRLLFSLERGDVVWSEMRSHEVMGVSGEKMDVRSCMVSEMKMNPEYKIKFECDPNQEAVTKTPLY